MSAAQPFAAKALEKGPVPFGPEVDEHVFRRETGQIMSQFPARERLPLPEPVGRASDQISEYAPGTGGG